MKANLERCQAIQQAHALQVNELRADELISRQRYFELTDKLARDVVLQVPQPPEPRLELGDPPRIVDRARCEALGDASEVDQCLADKEAWPLCAEADRRLRAEIVGLKKSGKAWRFAVGLLLVVSDHPDADPELVRWWQQQTAAQDREIELARQQEAARQKWEAEQARKRAAEGLADGQRFEGQ
ncbi:MAG: hypothetical protein AAFN74_05210 [Myxococcota bacterium]